MITAYSGIVSDWDLEFPSSKISDAWIEGTIVETYISKVEEEDYDLAAQLKQQIDQLRKYASPKYTASPPHPPPPAIQQPAMANTIKENEEPQPPINNVIATKKFSIMLNELLYLKMSGDSF